MPGKPEFSNSPTISGTTLSGLRPASGRAGNGGSTGTHDTKTLVMADAVAIKSQISLIKSVSPNVDDPVHVIYGNQNWHTSYRGDTPEYLTSSAGAIRSRYVSSGAASVLIRYPETLLCHCIQID